MDQCNIQDGYFYAVGDNNTVIVKSIKVYNENKNLMLRNLSMLSGNFTGRGHYLFKIKSSLGKYGCITLVGNGGIGKTQIALKYINDNKEQYKHIAFINASSYYSIKNDYSQILDIENDDSVINYMKHWSSVNKNWLFVYDNLDNMQLKSNFFKQYMVDPSNGHIIITSRLSNWDREIYIDVFDKQESTEFLSKKTMRYDRNHLESLSNQLGNFPLALEQAGAYIKNSCISYEEYSKLFQNYTNRLNLLGIEKPDSYHSTTLKTWSLSLASITNQAAIDLLNIVSFFSRESIPLSLFEEGKNSLPEQLKEQFENKLNMINLFRELSNYSLIKYEGEHFYIHNLVQDVIRLNLNQNKWCNIVIKLIFNSFNYNCYNKNSLDKNTSLVPHVLSICEYYHDIIGQSIELMMLYHKVACLYREKGMYEDSMLLHEYILKQTKGNFKDEDNFEIFLAEIYNSLAVLYSDIGNMKKSEKMFKESIFIRENLFGKTHEITSQSYNGLATLYITLKKYTIAEGLLKKVIDIRKKIYKKNPCYIGATYNNLAILYYNLKKYTESEKMYKKAISIWENNLEKDNLLLATSYNNIAILYKDVKEFNMAEIFYKKSINIYNNKLGSTHPYLAISYNNLAELYFVCNNYEEAEIYYKESLDIFNNIFGIKSKYSILSYSNLVKLYKKLNIYSERKVLLDKYFSKNNVSTKRSIAYQKLYSEYINSREIKPIYKNSLIYTPLVFAIAFIKLNSKKSIVIAATIPTAIGLVLFTQPSSLQSEGTIPDAMIITKTEIPNISVTTLDNLSPTPSVSQLVTTSMTPSVSQLVTTSMTPSVSQLVTTSITPSVSQSETPTPKPKLICSMRLDDTNNEIIITIKNGGNNDTGKFTFDFKKDNNLFKNVAINNITIGDSAKDVISDLTEKGNYSIKVNYEGTCEDENGAILTDNELLLKVKLITG
jgi:tetratricopeptide (TPR) repeat protein